MPDSPAIDAALTIPGINVDQSGVARPFGAAPDIGASEWNGTNFYSQFKLFSLDPKNDSWILKGGGPPNRTFRLRVSRDLINWSDATMGASGPRGIFELSEPIDPSESIRFYQVVAPN
jgi:hypothetical protein